MTAADDRELSSAPSMLPMFARAGVAMIPGASRLPFVGGGGGEIPEQALALRDVEIDRDRLAAYDRVCGFAVGDTLPPTYPHMLAFPLHLALMTSGRFPFPAIGLVHISNRIVQYRPIDAGERLSLRVWAGRVQPHPRGQQFAIHTEAKVGDEVVWTESSTNLKRGKGSGEPLQSDDPPSAEGLPATATWRCSGDLGRRYGAVSGDLNPIHVHPLTARLFGFPSAIAHGMWTKARCLAALGAQLPAAFTVRVAFKRPILLPATVQFAEAAGAGVGEIAFGVRDAKRDTPHLDGLVVASAG
ncbi:MAG TPA: MaoC/PaaZ C-terminal domain-containing protein [Solirubrobacteraceae bacterium]|jgi:acyl dehydratase